MAGTGTELEMQAVVVDSAAPSRLAIRTVDRPAPGPGDVLVRVKAFSLNRGETRMALHEASDGWRPGWDIAGVVEAAAADGSGPRFGARVVGSTVGGWADLAALPTSRVAELPDGVSFAQAATLPVAGLTARAALQKGGDLTGRPVLIGGASGGVGTFALQLARQAGAHVVAAIRDPSQEEMVRRLGADNVAIGPSLESAEPLGPFHLILESVGAASLGKALEMLAPGGTCVLLGASAGSTTTFDGARFRAGGTSLYGLVMGYEFTIEPPSVGLADLAQRVARGELIPEIRHEAPWSHIGQVADALMDRTFTGKAVLHIT